MSVVKGPDSGELGEGGVVNEYLDEFNELQDSHKFAGQQWFGHRQRLVEKYGWAVPNDMVLEYISGAFDIITEIGAGEGYWAHMLSEYGTKVHAFDKDTDRAWYNVRERRLSSVDNYIEDNPVLMVWPPVNDDLAVDVLSYEPSHVMYVGESSGGCTANDEFFEVLNRNYGPVEKIDIPSYMGINDDFYHYVRKL